MFLQPKSGICSKAIPLACVLTVVALTHSARAAAKATAVGGGEWVQVVNPPPNFGSNPSNPSTFTTWGGSSGSGAHSGSWSEWSPVWGTDGAPLVGVIAGEAIAKSSEPSGEHHSASFGTSNTLNLFNGTTRLMTLDLKATVRYDLEVILDRPPLDSGCANFYFNVTNLRPDHSDNQTLVERTWSLCSNGHEVSPDDLAWNGTVTIPVNETAHLIVQSWVAADAKTVSAPEPASLAALLPAILIAVRRRRHQQSRQS